MHEEVEGGLLASALACRLGWSEYRALPGSTFMPAPGCQRLTITRPTIRASVVIASKYSNAFSPTRPTFFMSSMLAMPCTTVQKMIGAISILISLMKRVTQRLHLGAKRWVEMPEQDAEHDGAQDLRVEVLVPLVMGRDRGTGYGARRRCHAEPPIAGSRLLGRLGVENGERGHVHNAPDRAGRRQDVCRPRRAKQDRPDGDALTCHDLECVVGDVGGVQIR